MATKVGKSGDKKPRTTHEGLRDLLDHAEGIGELLKIDGADWDLEIGGILEMIHHHDSLNTPALLFDNIKGYPKGFRITSGTSSSVRRFSAALGLGEARTPMESVRAYRDMMRGDFALIPPREVNGGPIMENVDRDDAVDLTKFPVPRLHEQDGGRYIGTDDVIVMRDPETGWVNAATYRIQLHDKNTTGLWMSPGKQGREILAKYEARGERCPVLICMGHDPALFLAASSEVPNGTSEFDYAAGLRGRAYDVVKSELHGLPMPAHAEIVLEGEVITDEKRPEGPFGEFTGYYASAVSDEPIIRIKRAYYRNDPILTVACPMRPPADYTAGKSVMKSGMLWDEMETAGIRGIQGVWIHWATKMFVVVSIKQLYAGHVMQAGLIATAAFSNAYMGRYVVIVDDDIDPSDTDAVLWAMGTRSEPADDITTMRNMWSSPLDPMLRNPPWQSTRAIIDACRPWQWRNEFPAVAESRPELREAIRKKWGHLLND